MCLLLSVHYPTNCETDTFLQINDQLNSVLNRYEAFKKGDYAAASNPIPSELSAKGQAQNDLSLIDFDDSAANTSPSQPAQGGAMSGIDELASLFSSPGAAPPPNPLAQSPAGFSAQPQQQSLQSLFSSPPPNIGVAQRALSPQYSGSQNGTPMGTIRLPGTPQGQTARLGSPGPNYFSPVSSPTGQVGMGAGMGAGMGSGMSVGMGSGMGAGMGRGMNGMSNTVFGSQPMQPQQQQQQQQSPAAANNPTPNNQSQGKDPFADLVGLF